MAWGAPWCSGSNPIKGLHGDDHSGDVVVAMWYFYWIHHPRVQHKKQLWYRAVPVSRLCQVSGYQNPGTDMDIVLLGSDGRTRTAKGSHDGSHKPLLSRQVYQLIISLDLSIKLLSLDLLVSSNLKTIMIEYLNTLDLPTA